MRIKITDSDIPLGSIIYNPNTGARYQLIEKGDNDLFDEELFYLNPIPPYIQETQKFSIPLKSVRDLKYEVDF